MISIITSTYNSEKTILDSLSSISQQSYKNIESIVVDGGSADRTLDIIKKMKYVNHIISEPDKGIYDAFNKGLSIAKGDIIGFLNSDDTFYDDISLATIANAFNPDVDCVFGNLDYVNDKGEIIRKWRSKPFVKGSFIKGWKPAHPTFYCKREVYERLGGYVDTFRIAGDFELMLRYLEKNNVRTKFIDQTLIKMKTGGISNSGLQSKVLILKEELSAFKMNKIKINSTKYIIHKMKKLKEFF